MDMDPLIQSDSAVVVVGFFDLMGYASWCAGRPPREPLELAMKLFERAGRAINGAGGRLIKAIGDAGLFVFPADKPDQAVLALIALKRDCDAWLAERGYPEVMAVKVCVGPVACGNVGPPGDERLDVYGETVNQAARMKAQTFSIANGIMDQLTGPSRENFARFNDHEFVLKS